MTIPERIEVFELDEDREVCGKRTVPSGDLIIPKYRPSDYVSALSINIQNAFTCIESVEVSWLAHEEYPDYEAANKSRYFGEITFFVSGVLEDQYSDCFTSFRQKAIDPLCRLLGFSSWGFGKGIVDRRGQDLFIVELDGFEKPSWTLFWTIGKADTYAKCWEVTESVEEFAIHDLRALLGLRD
jgi:hypothetical protein